jgi:signal peptidase
VSVPRERIVAYPAPRAELPALSAAGFARRLLGLAGTVAMGFCLAIVVALGVPRLLGYQIFTGLSGSMTPTLEVGDVVVGSRLAPLDARIGDVVTFRSPENQKRLITHRVVSVRAFDGRVAFVTKGDVNTGTERWSVPADGTIARVEYRIPKLGYVANRLGGRFGRFSLIVIPALLLGIYELIRIWRPRPS